MLHIINLVSKSLLKSFDVPKKGWSIPEFQSTETDDEELRWDIDDVSEGEQNTSVDETDNIEG